MHEDSRSSLWWRVAFTAMLTLAMAAGTFVQFALGVLAPFLTAEFALSRVALGTLTTTLFLVGASFTPLAGVLVDRWGARRSLVLLFAAAIVALGLLGTAPSYTGLAAGAAVAGLALSLGNPATNRLLARHVPAGSQGVIVGVKQSGVQAGGLLAGVLLPVSAAAFGWRGVLLAAAAVPLLGILGTASLVPADVRGESGRAGFSLRLLRGPLGWLAACAFFIGAGLAPVTTYLPLYAHEQLGFPVTEAGLVGGAAGLAGVLGRVLWGWLSERRGSTLTPLVFVSLGAVGAALLVDAASVGSPAVIWPAAGLLGITAGAWMAVGMLSALRVGGQHAVGRATAAVAVCFHAGFVPSPALFGRVVDATGSYGQAWLLVVGAFACAALVTLRLRWLVRGRGARPNDEAARDAVPGATSPRATRPPR